MYEPVTPAFDSQFVGMQDSWTFPSSKESRTISPGSALPSTFTLVAEMVPPSVEETVPAVPDLGVICCIETKSALTIGTMLRSIENITTKARIDLLVFNYLFTTYFPSRSRTVLLLMRAQ